MKISRPHILYASLLLAAATLLLALRITEVPPPWFDEGWVLSVARNWVVLGHYGQLLDGRPIIGNMPSVGIPMIAPIALSFRVFGIGVWQGRLPGVIFTLAALWFLYSLTYRLYDGRASLWALFASLFTSTMPSISPVIIGRQALGEMPGLCFLLAGYLCLVRAPQNFWFAALASGLWGLAIATKLLFLPFLVVGIGAAVVSLACRRYWGQAALVSATLIGALASSQLIAAVEMLLQGPGASLGGSRSAFVATLLVPVSGLRIAALRTIALTGLPAFVGLLTAACVFRKRWLTGKVQWVDTVSLSLMVFIASWVAWYLLMSYGWPRYLFPPLFAGGIFAGLLLARLTRAADPVDDGLPAMKQRATGRYLGTREIVPKLALAVVILLSIVSLCVVLVSTPRSSMMGVIEYVNTCVPSDALVETYEMELLFLMNRRYHYPPDVIQLQLNRRTYGGQGIEIDYDPLKDDPDYLIVGEHGALWHLYDKVIEAGHFRLLIDFSSYRVYGRVRQRSSRISFSQ